MKITFTIFGAAALGILVAATWACGIRFAGRVARWVWNGK
jgi:hypothetical protein